jgi:hypothetical protein
MRVHRQLVSLFAAILFGTVAPAQAGTAELREECLGPYATCTGFLTYEGAPGESNRVTVTFEDPDTFVLRDTGASVSAGRGCVSDPADAERAICTGSASGYYVWISGNHGSDWLVAPDIDRLGKGLGIQLLGGEGADFLVGQDGRETLDGGAGDDYLVGGAHDDELIGGEGVDSLEGGDGNDVLRGGTGSDTLRGGQGRDLASYRMSRKGVRADLEGDRDDGPPGEQDLIADDIESLVGSNLDDLLVGDDRPNGIGGGISSDEGDRIYGRGGDDVLGARGPANRIYGQAGDDLVTGGRKDDYLSGGGGDDDVRGYEGLDTLVAGTGDDRLDPGVGGGRDRVWCGSGSDLAFLGDDLVGSCERYRTRVACFGRTGGCELLVRITTRETNPVVIAERRVTKRRPGSHSVAISLNATGRRLLTERGKLAARQVVTDQAGKRRAFNFTLKR